MRQKWILICIQISVILFLGAAVKNVSADTPFIGEVRWFAGNYAPQGWAFCDGQILYIAQHQALYSILGTTYGGDGRTTFALPDMRGRAMLHEGYGGLGLSPRALGQRSGAELSNLSVTELPSHTHGLRANSTSGDTVLPNDRVVSKSGRLKLYDNVADVNMHPSSISATGGNSGHENMQPYITANCIISLTGLYPSRS